MDVEGALADLMELSAQVEQAVVLDRAGTLLGSTAGEGEQTSALAASARRLLEAAGEVRPGAEVSQVAAATRRGGVFVVRDDLRTVAAATGRDASAALVFYDLKTCLRALSEEGGDGAAG